MLNTLAVISLIISVVSAGISATMEYMNLTQEDLKSVFAFLKKGEDNE